MSGYHTATVVFSMLGKSLICIAYSVVYVFGNEIFPTEVRNIGVGTAIMGSHVTSMMAAYVGGPMVCKFSFTYLYVHVCTEAVDTFVASFMVLMKTTLLMPFCGVRSCIQGGSKQNTQKKISCNSAITMNYNFTKQCFGNSLHKRLPKPFCKSENRILCGCQVISNFLPGYFI